jgi:hypothetical protein
MVSTPRAGSKRRAVARQSPWQGVFHHEKTGGQMYFLDLDLTPVPRFYRVLRQS